MKEAFRKVASRVSVAAGSPAVFFVAALLVICWAVSGPFFGYSNTWQLFINTVTTISTFLVVFLIQNTQNRESKSLQLKLDELIRASRSARDEFLTLESMPDDELDKLDADFQKIGADEATHLLHPLHKHLQKEKARRSGGSNSLAADVTDAIKRAVGH